MLHLFDKVYISFDDSILINQNRIVISEKHGKTLIDNIQEKNIFNVNFFEYYESIDELVGSQKKYSTYEDFFIKILDLSRDVGKIIIYCDKICFVKLFVIWNKLCLKNIDKVSSWNFFKCNLVKHNLFFNYKFNMNTPIHIEKISIEKEEFVKIFEEIKIDFNYYFLQKIKKSLGLEIILSSFLYNESCYDELQKIIYIMLTRTFHDLIIESKQEVYKNILRSSFTETMNFQNYTIDNFENFLFDEKIKVLNNSNLCNSQNIGLTGSLSNINLKQATDQEIIEIKFMIKQLMLEWDKFSDNNFILEKIELLDLIKKEKLEKEDIYKIIKMETEQGSTIRFFSSSDFENINFYFIDYILECYLKNEKEKLNYYVVD